MKTKQLLEHSYLIRQTVSFPSKWTFLGSPNEVSQIPEDEKKKIFFLNEQTTKEVANWFSSHKIINTFSPQRPFTDNYFKRIKSFYLSDKESLSNYLSKITFSISENVFIWGDPSDYIVYLNKNSMVKHLPSVFTIDDCVCFDDTLNWCLFISHDDAKVTIGIND